MAQRQRQTKEGELRELILNGVSAKVVFDLVTRRGDEVDQLLCTIVQEPSMKEALIEKLRLMIRDSDYPPQAYGQINQTRAGGELLGDIGCQRTSANARLLHSLLATAEMGRDERPDPRTFGKPREIRYGHDALC